MPSRIVTPRWSKKLPGMMKGACVHGASSPPTVSGLLQTPAPKQEPVPAGERWEPQPGGFRAGWSQPQRRDCKAKHNPATRHGPVAFGPWLRVLETGCGGAARITPRPEHPVSTGDPKLSNLEGDPA